MKGTDTRIKIMIAEDQLVVLHALAALLEDVPDFNVIGIAGNGEDLLSLAIKNKPDIILMDIKMPKMNGLETARRIDEKMPWVKVIALSMYNHPVFIKEMLKNGAKGFLSKNCAPAELFEAIRNVHRGKTYLSGNIQEIILEDFTNSTASDNNQDIKSLTAREIEIIQMLAGGYMTREIAAQLFISEKTVERHKSNILRKMKLKNTAQLVKEAVENGLLFNSGQHYQ